MTHRKLAASALLLIASTLVAAAQTFSAVRPTDRMEPAASSPVKPTAPPHDAVALSENSWDFNNPHGVTGFGAMTDHEVREAMKHHGFSASADARGR